MGRGGAVEQKRGGDAAWKGGARGSCRGRGGNSAPPPAPLLRAPVNILPLHTASRGAQADGGAPLGKSAGLGERVGRAGVDMPG